MKTPHWFGRNYIPSRLRIAPAVTLIAAAVVSAIAAFNPDPRVSVGSPTRPFAQNKQNEPALAVDANHPNILVAGANDEIDLEACNAGDDTASWITHRRADELADILHWRPPLETTERAPPMNWEAPAGSRAASVRRND